MWVRGRLGVGVVLLAVSIAGCALFDSGSEAADCQAVRVAFEDALGHVRGEGGPEATDATTEGEGGQGALRDVVAFHDARQDCFEDEYQEFLGPARDELGEEQGDFLEPVRQPGALQDSAGGSADQAPGMLGEGFGGTGED